MGQFVLQMKGIKKSFNRVQVLKEIHFKLKKGEIHALLGENGAGKSTLMNILGGVIQADEGQIYLAGKQVNITDPQVAKSLGIRFIHQELNIVSDLRVYENLFLGAELTDRFGFLKVEEMCRKTREVLKQMGVYLHPKTYLRDLDTSYKQIIEIARALLEEPTLIIMDEPTTSLTENEVTHLFQLMKSLKNSGVSIIYISHKLKEVLDICDQYTVLRDGELVGTGAIGEVDEEQLTKLMVGQSIAGLTYYQPRKLGKPILQVENLSDGQHFQQVSFTLHEGEILGITGLAGDGRTELVESIFGYRKGYAGEIKVDGQNRKLNHPQQALQAGIALVPKNRKENAIIKDLSVRQNMSLSALPNYEYHYFIDSRLEKSKFEEYKHMLNIKVSDPDIPIVRLSGGNQQKVILAKWLEVDAKIIILDNPTQGIDVGAKSEIYHLIMNLAKQGKAIIILSSEAAEILKLSDRVMVMYQGQIMATLERWQANEENILLYATGAKREVHMQ